MLLPPLTSSIQSAVLSQALLRQVLLPALRAARTAPSTTVKSTLAMPPQVPQLATSAQESSAPHRQVSLFKALSYSMPPANLLKPMGRHSRVEQVTKGPAMSHTTLACSLCGWLGKTFQLALLRSVSTQGSLSTVTMLLIRPRIASGMEVSPMPKQRPTLQPPL